MELKDGMYVRTTYGDIAKIIGCPKVLEKEYGKYMWIETMDEQRPTDDKLIKKASYSIIDLIEVGDYVNGHLVEDLDDLGYIEIDNDTIKYDDIKTIVTKEQFESMKYEVK